MWSDYVFTYVYFMTWLLVVKMEKVDYGDSFSWVLFDLPLKKFFLILLLFLGRRGLWFSHPCGCEARKRGWEVELGVWRLLLSPTSYVHLRAGPKHKLISLASD